MEQALIPYFSSFGNQQDLIMENACKLHDMDNPIQISQSSIITNRLHLFRWGEHYDFTKLFHQYRKSGTFISISWSDWSATRFATSTLHENLAYLHKFFSTSIRHKLDFCAALSSRDKIVFLKINKSRKKRYAVHFHDDEVTMRSYTQKYAFGKCYWKR